jgi:adenosylcobinamide-GDP ribazoletransferase
MSVFQSVVALFQFTTIIPLGKTAPFESFARRCWLYPIAGYLTGGIAGFVLFIFPAPAMVSAALGIGLIFLLTGCNHLDGLLDLGDGLMAHGNRIDRIRALTDRTIGTGGIALGITVTLLAWSSLASVPIIWAAIVVAEVAGKYSMAVMTIYGNPFHEGLHASLHRQTKEWFIIPASFLLIPLFALPLSRFSLMISIILMISVPVVLIVIASRLFGGVNGDVTGAAGEIARACVLTALACTISLPEIPGFLSITT